MNNNEEKTEILYFKILINKTKQQEILRPKRAMLFEILRKIKHSKTHKNKKKNKYNHENLYMKIYIHIYFVE